MAVGGITIDLLLYSEKQALLVECSQGGLLLPVHGPRFSRKLSISENGTRGCLALCPAPQQDKEWITLHVFEGIKF